MPLASLSSTYLISFPSTESIGMISDLSRFARHWFISSFSTLVGRIEDSSVFSKNRELDKEKIH